VGQPHERITRELSRCPVAAGGLQLNLSQPAPAPFHTASLANSALSVVFINLGIHARLEMRTTAVVQNPKIVSLEEGLAARRQLLVRGTHRSPQPELASEEVNHVSILFGHHGISRCRRGLHRRAGGVGRENIWQETNSGSPAELK
jgi:hypothetical protein